MKLLFKKLDAASSKNVFLVDLKSIVLETKALTKISLAEGREQIQRLSRPGSVQL